MADATHGGIDKIRQINMGLDKINEKFLNRLYREKNWLYQKYLIENLSTREIAALIPTSMSVIRNWLQRHDIPIKNIDVIAKRKEHADYMREYYRKHPEKNRNNVKRWRHSKPYGIHRKKEKRSIPNEWKQIIINFLSERDGENCFYCNKKIKKKDLSIAHVISPLRGGAQTVDNLRLSHRRCNIIEGISVRRLLRGH